MVAALVVSDTDAVFPLPGREDLQLGTAEGAAGTGAGPVLHPLLGAFPGKCQEPQDLIHARLQTNAIQLAGV